MHHSKNNSPIFVIGNPRSGTSLLRLMLHSHPLICIPPECHFFLWLEERYGNFCSSQLSDYVNDLFQSRKFETWKLDKSDLTNYLQAKIPQNYSELTSSIYSFYANMNNKSDAIHWGDKNKLWKQKLSTIVKYFPNAKFIHIVRDGRDVACSFRELGQKSVDSKYYPKLPVEVAEIASRWTTNLQFISDFLSTLNASNFVEIKYEDLVSSTRLQLQSLFHFLSLEYSEMSENYYVGKSFEDIEPKEFMQWKAKLTSAPDVRNISKYKNEMTLKEIDAFEKIANGVLLKYGYL